MFQVVNNDENQTEANPKSEHDLLLQAVTAAGVPEAVLVTVPDYPTIIRRMSERHRQTYQRQYSENYRLKQTVKKAKDRILQLTRENLDLRRKIMELQKQLDKSGTNPKSS
jgi:predicted RNase H-like nuclease (RuvC/YqgF family)